MRPAAALVLPALLLGCREDVPSLEALLARAERDHEQARLEAANEAVAEVIARGARVPELEWRARVLAAEILLDRDEPDAGLDLVRGPLPAGLQGASVEARYHKVRGALAWRKGDHAAAELSLALAAELARPEDGGALALEVSWWRGVVQQSAGGVGRAVARFQEVLDRAVDHPRWRATALNSLAFVDLKADRCPAALPRLEQALAEASGVPMLVARIQLNLGICLTNSGDFERAEAVLNQAIATFQAAGARRFFQNALGSLANNHLLAGDRVKAIAVYERALALARPHDPVAAALWALNLATTHGDLQNWRLAGRHAEEARRLLASADQRRPNLLLLSIEARIADAAQDMAGAERGYQQVITGSSNQPEVLWLAQARLANVYQRLGRQDEAGALFAKALDTVERLRQQARELEHEISFLERLVCLHRDHVRWLIGQGKHAEALLAYESSRVQILAGRLGRARPGSPPVGEDLREKARWRGEVLISYMLTPRGSFAWVVDGQNVRVVDLPPEPEIEKAAGAYRAFIDSSLRDPRQIENSPAHALYKMVVAPLLPALSAGARVTVAPDGALHGVPLGALVVAASEGQPARYWIENVTLTVTPSLLTLPEHAPEGGVGSAGAGLVGIGDAPDAGVEFPRLPSAGDELTALERHFPGHKRLMGRGAEARPEFYRQPQLGTAALIHFATHALANPMRPLDSTIVLAPGPGGSRLSVRDVLNVPLEAQLVTISACRSAGARHYHGEGLVGLAWGFLTAGARHVVAGLWDVPDRSTGELMDRMYAELARGARPAEALRAAQLSLAQKPGAWGTPFYWAAFQVYAGAGPADGKPGHLAAKKATARL